MSVFQALYDQSPAVVWLAAGGLLIMLELATGSARLTPVALAALAPAAMALARLPLGSVGEAVAFVTIAGAGTALMRFAPPRPATASPAPGRSRSGRAPKPSRPAESNGKPSRTAADRRRSRRHSRPAVLNLDGSDTPTLNALTAARPPAAVSSGPVAPVAQLSLAPTASSLTVSSAAVVKPAPSVKPASAKRSGPPGATVATPADPNRARRLVGATARTTGEFANGVGRVWLDGSEWGAELDHGEELEGDRAVEVVAVSGGVRLTVRPLPMPA